MSHIVECKPDLLLARVIGIGNVCHGGNNVGVIRACAKGNNRMTGLIDEDPWGTKPREFRKFVTDMRYHRAEEVGGMCDIELKMHPLSSNRLVILKPRLEEWLIRTGELDGSRARDFDLPEEGPALHEIINLNLEKLGRWLRDLRTRNSRRLQRLQEVLSG